MELPQIKADHGVILREHPGYQIRLLILGPDQLKSLDAFIAVLFAVVPKHELVVMLRVHRADSYSVARAWGRAESRFSYRSQIDEIILNSGKTLKEASE